MSRRSSVTLFVLGSAAMLTLGACAQLLGGVEGSGPSGSGPGSGGNGPTSTSASGSSDGGSGGTTSHQGGGGAGPGSSSSSGGGTVPTCDEYCNTLSTNCKGVDIDYTNLDICKAVCKNFDKGNPGDTTGDSLACRAHYANLAAQSHAKYCQAAGLTGEGLCTDACAGFCTSAYRLCGPLEFFPYMSEPDCEMQCANYPYTLNSSHGDAGPGDVGATSGNTLNCRIYHLEAAYDPNVMNAAMAHCGHIGTPAMSPICGM